MPLHHRVSLRAVELVKRFEGYRRAAARLPGGGWVLGHGHTASAREGARVSPAEAEALLLYDLSRIAVRVEAALLAPVSAQQFEALTAFAFHIGPEAFAASEVLRRLNAGAYLQAAAALELWRRAEVGGQAVVVDAFVRRRAAEKAHFLSGSAQAPAIPGALARPLLDHEVLAVADRWPAPPTAVLAVDEADGALRPVLADPPGLSGEPAPSAAIAAVDSIAARLSRILAETAPPPLPPAPATPPEPPGPGPVEAPEPAPFPAEPPAPEPAPVAPPPVEIAPAASFPQAMAAVTAPPIEPGPALLRASAPRGFAPAASARPRPRWRVVLEDWRLLAALAVIGLGLVAFAVASLLTGRPSFGLLLIGLLGVAALMPALGARLAR